MTKLILRFVLAAFMVFAGSMHFARPAGFVATVPNYLPSPLALVYISGFFEILGGIGICVPQVQYAAAWGLIALYIAVFPANVYMATHQVPFMGEIYPIAGWVRLPFQALFIVWAYWLRTE